MSQTTHHLPQHRGVTLIAAMIAFLLCMVAAGTSFRITSTVLAPGQAPTHATMPMPTPGPSLA